VRVDRTVEIVLSEDERETLRRWARRHSSSQALTLRSKIMLACAEGRTNTAIAGELGCDRVTVSKWRHRFAAERLEGLGDLSPLPPGAARQVGDEVVGAIVVETLETTPKDATHWSTRALAERHRISQQTVSEIWRAFTAEADSGIGRILAREGDEMAISTKVRLVLVRDSSVPDGWRVLTAFPDL
jgi:hypothetical protein